MYLFENLKLGLVKELYLKTDEVVSVELNLQLSLHFKIEQQILKILKFIIAKIYCSKTKYFLRYRNLTCLHIIALNCTETEL